MKNLMRESIFRRIVIWFVTVEVDEVPCIGQAAPYVVVVRVNGSHLIKNYLIAFLALISTLGSLLAVHHDYLATTATSFSSALCPSRFYSPTPPTPSPFSYLLHLLTPSSVSALRSHLLNGGLCLGCSFQSFFPSLLSRSGFSLQPPFFFRRISNHRRANFPARAYREIPSNVGPLLEPVDS